MGPGVGSDVDGAEVGPGVGSEVDGPSVGLGVGSEVVGCGVGSEVVGSLVGLGVGPGVGLGVGRLVGHRSGDVVTESTSGAPQTRCWYPKMRLKTSLVADAGESAPRSRSAPSVRSCALSSSLSMSFRNGIMSWSIGESNVSGMPYTVTSSSARLVLYEHRS